MWLVVGVALSACRTIALEPLPGPGEPARAAMERASALLRHGTDTTLVREALLEAIQLAPDWEVPRRRLDDISREGLLGPKALRAHWQAMQAGDATDLHGYLSGRLNPSASALRFQQAHRTEPRNPWALHGMAFVAANQGRLGRARDLQSQAMQLARDPEELRLFTQAMGRFQRQAGDLEGARATLAEFWEAMDPGAARDGVELELLTVELATGTEADLLRAKVRAARLLRHGDLSPLQLALLAESGVVDPAQARAWLYLRSLEGTTGEWARELSLRLLEAEDPNAFGGQANRSPVARSVRAETVELFGKGQVVEAWDHWRYSLPESLGGIFIYRPEFYSLQQAMVMHRADSSNAEVAQRVLDDLMAVGWFDEAQAYARTLPGGIELNAAMAMEAQATLAKRCLAGLAELMQKVDRGLAAIEPSAPLQMSESHDGTVKSLDDLLRAVAQVLWTAGPRFYGEQSKADLEDKLVASPRLNFGPFAQVVHPGPEIARWDAQRGLGKVLEPVPGLAQELGRLGRVGIFGSAMGVGAPDATILRLVYAEPIEGEHLGVAFQGTVLWCDGADVGARNVRQGASVAGAALHEGYFVDLQAVRLSHSGWQRLAERFQAGGSRERLLRLQEILADPGLPVHAPERIAMRTEPVPFPYLDKEPAPMDPWILTHALLGQADRNRLAWMGEHAQAKGLAPGSLLPPSFDEVVRLTAVHEEGHLCERTRYLPLSEHWYAAFGFLADLGFSPIRVQERLEYRAQLVALCEMPDPRLALVDILALAEGTPSGLPHGPAYADLLQDLVAELGLGLREQAPWLKGLKMDEEHRLVFQLHRVPIEALRATALRVAAREGLIGSDYLGK